MVNSICTLLTKRKCNCGQNMPIRYNFAAPFGEKIENCLIAPISFEVEGIQEVKEFDITSFSNKLKAIPLAIVALDQNF
jgi:hypothetical protein